MFKRIFVSTDGTTQSARAVKAGAAFANSLGATLTLFHASRTYKSHYYPDAGGIAWPLRSSI